MDNYNSNIKNILCKNKLNYVNNLIELENLLIKFEPNKCNLVGYIWQEYGYIPVLINYIFNDFFEFNCNNGLIIGLCFEGMEPIYINKVDKLIVLKNFINTENAIKDSNYTNKWNYVKNNITNDGGIAFWHTIKNFNEDEFNILLEKLNFKNIIWPHYYGNGTSTLFYRNKFGKTCLGSKFLYATGEKNLYSTDNIFLKNKLTEYGEKINEKNFGWLYLYNNKIFDKYNLPRLFDTPYACCFIRNCHKNYTVSSTIGFKLNKTIELCIKNKIHLILFQDLIYTEIPKNEYIHEVYFNNFFDITKFIYYTYHCSYYFGTTTSTHEIFSYYSGINSNVISYLYHPKIYNNNIEYACAFDGLINIQKKKNKKFLYLVEEKNINNVDDLLKNNKINNEIINYNIDNIINNTKIPLIKNPFLNYILQNNNYTEEQKNLIHNFKNNGYLIIDLNLKNEFIDNLIKTLYTNNNLNNHYNENYFHYNDSKRIVNAWENNKYVKELALNKKILDYLELLYGRSPFPHLTINFNKGTEQPIHSDTIHFNCMPQDWMAVCWIALEDINENNGPISYIPKSHTLIDINYNNLNLKQEENNSKLNEYNYNIYNKVIEKLIEVNNLKIEKLYIKKGQAIIWDSKLLHGGSKIIDPYSTRFSQVQHYFFNDCDKYYHPMWSNINKGIFAEKWCSEKKNISNCDKR